MRFTRQLLVVPIAIVGAVLFAPAAVGQSLEVTREPINNHCGTVSVGAHTPSGGCVVHVASTGNIDLRQHIFGVESHVTVCSNEFEMRVNEDGSGFIDKQHFGGASCTREACNEEANAATDPWPFSMSESDGTEKLMLTFCVNAIGAHAESTCEIDIPFRESLFQNHQYEFGTLGGGGLPVEIPGTGPAGFRCELAAHWQTETISIGDETVEIIHL